MEVYRLLANGDLLSSESNFPVPNPSTLEEVGRCPIATQAQVDAAVEGAASAKPAWSALSLEKRKEYLMKAAAVMEENIDELGKLLVLEQGKPLHVAGRTGEVSWAITLLRKVASEISLEPETIN